MPDRHANLFVGLTAPSAFPAFVQHAATHPSHHNFHVAWSPVLRGTGIFSEIIYERCFRLGPTIRPKRQRNGSAGASPPRLQWICTERDLQDGGREAFGRAEWKRLSDIVHMEESKQSRSGEGPGPQDRPLKEAEDPLKEKAISPGQPAGEKAAEDQETEELPAPDEEPGTFDRVYEHGRQMGF